MAISCEILQTCTPFQEIPTACGLGMTVAIAAWFFYLSLVSHQQGRRVMTRPYGSFDPLKKSAMGFSHGGFY